MKVGIQGGRCSACDMAAMEMLKQHQGSVTFEYLVDALGVLDALSAGRIDAAVLAAESPLGVPLSETSAALERFPKVEELSDYRSEPRHCILTRSKNVAQIRQIASHPVPLRKHAEYLAQRFPNYTPIPMADTGEAAKELAVGNLSDDTAVIAMPLAAQVFGLFILEAALPANDNYLTKFVLVGRKQ